MWTRRELKDKAKVAFRANYWKTVLVGLLMAVLIGGFTGFRAVPSAAPGATRVDSAPQSARIHVDGSGSSNGVTIDINDMDEKLSISDDEGNHVELDGRSSEAVGIATLFAGLSLMLVLLVVFAVILVFNAFILNPLEVGGQRFLLRNLNRPAEVKELAYAFDTNYRETVKGLFIRDLCIMAWSLLLIIPGIVKSYEYRMMPYLYADDPTMTKERAFAESKQMMTGQKWSAFVLDLSFIGWNILSVLTLGILALFYVNPYQNQTNAALYEKLRYGLPAPEPVASPQGFMPGIAAGQSTQPVYGQSGYQNFEPPIPPFAAADAPAPVWYDESQSIGDSSEAEMHDSGNILDGMNTPKVDIVSDEGEKLETDNDSVASKSAEA